MLRLLAFEGAFLAFDRLTDLRSPCWEIRIIEDDVSGTAAA
jgi:hypothetical protein